MENVILNTPLPLTQDFKSLKEEALAYVQAYGANTWTNLNPSDPGVTIIDQLCYALTELGYCNGFAISDILTGANGKLQLNNQFYLPENILTTSPVTVNDYKKYLIDSVDGLKNAMIYAENNVFYQIFFAVKEGETTEQMPLEVFYSLNKCRNMNELFLPPVALIPYTQYLTGTIEITDENEVSAILMAINKAIKNYIFPFVKQVGYLALEQEGLTSDEIFNGPLLQHGWIDHNALGTKRTTISVDEIYEVMMTIGGVSKVVQLALVDENESVYNPTTQIFDIAMGRLSVSCKGKTLNFNLDQVLSRTKPAEIDVVLGAAVDVQTEVPKGKYRDINSYYSIQNTFPEIYAVGASAIIANATKFQIAQSRQLKGYLTLFDQVLANQFSQLANVEQLFSFKNSMTANPSDLKEFYAVKTDEEKRHIIYPAPYLTFSPSYFYQSIYHIPNIRPLLKDNNEFRLMRNDESKKELAHESWLAYKQNPYNPYMNGLMAFMTDERNDLTRRNTILDHLLARHGESPLVIDALIDGTTYTRNKLKDQVIIKSLYLQNLGLLSYHRFKAYNFLGANRLENLSAQVPVSYEQAIYDNDTIDFIFNMEKVDHQEKLTAIDFINYSGLELKLGLLFGLKVQYKNYIIDCYQNTDEIDRGNAIRLATWMIQQRKGFIFLETNLLWAYTTFEIQLILNNSLCVFKEPVDYRQLLTIYTIFIQKRQFSILIYDGQQFLQVGDYRFPVEIFEAPIQEQAAENAFFFLKIENGPVLNSDQMEMIFDQAVALVFPLFLKSETFINRLIIFLQESLPATLSYNYTFIDDDLLEPFVSTFVSWHNSLLFVDPSVPQGLVSHLDNEQGTVFPAAAMANQFFQLKWDSDE